MSNPSRPATCSPTCATPCTSCGCSECGALVDRDTLRPLALPSGRVVQACAACMEGEAVPETVEEEASGDVTVRAAYVPIGRAGLGEVRAERKAVAL